jgi:hypothetical protein
MPEDKPFTLDDYKSMLEDATRRFAIDYLELLRSNPLLDMLSKDYIPPTRRQRLRNRLNDLRRRAKDIWTILRGGDVHEDCGH